MRRQARHTIVHGKAQEESPLGKSPEAPATGYIDAYAAVKGLEVEGHRGIRKASLTDFAEAKTRS